MIAIKDYSFSFFDHKEILFLFLYKNIEKKVL